MEVDILSEIDKLEQEYAIAPSFDKLCYLSKLMVKTQNAKKASEGLKNLFTQLYPDHAHYIFELLQNAQDANRNGKKPSTVRFLLTREGLEFEHDGEKLFDIKDIESITGLGVSTKREDKTNIGKFGIGFKSVFAITDVPEIISGPYHFKIIDMFIPELISYQENNVSVSRFCFLFNENAKQSINSIEKELRELESETLLFLKNINKIEFLLPDGETLGVMERLDEENGIITIKSDIPGKEEKLFHWLRYFKEVTIVNEKGDPILCPIAIAFKLEKNEKKGKNNEWKIISADPGKVCIFFPARKETSKLRFNIHAPFASTVARDSVRDCEENNRLRDAIAELIVESLDDIKNRGLLSIDFLALLPNKEDELSGYYEVIREKIASAFKEKPLLPTKNGNYAPANELFRGSARISEVIDDDDLSLLTGKNIPLWAKNVPQNNQREDRFLDSLDMQEWGKARLCSIFNPKTDEEKIKIEGWISQKSDTWLMKLYALLGNEQINVQSSLCVVKTTTNCLAMASDVYFLPKDGEQIPVNLNFVKPDIYNTGDAEERKKNARSFLEKIGVKQYDEEEKRRLHIRKLASKYSSPNHEISKAEHLADIKEFSNYEVSTELLKGKYFVLDADGNYCTADAVCTPIIGELIEQADLASEYQKAYINSIYEEIKEEECWKFMDLIEKLGAMHQLEVIPIKDYFTKDHIIRGIERIIPLLQSEHYGIMFAKLIWDAVQRCTIFFVGYRYSEPDGRCRYNDGYRKREYPSAIVGYLSSAAWIPDKDGNLFKPQDIAEDTLPEDFIINKDSYLFKALKFGENIRLADKAKREELERLAELQKNKEEAAITLNVSLEIVESIKVAEEAGINVKALLEKMLQNKNTFYEETEDEFDPMIDDKKEPFPEQEIKNMDKLRTTVADNYKNALDVSYEPVLRRIRTSRGKDREHIGFRYNGFCQICKERHHSWEVAELKTGPKKELEQMNLSLCPNCASLYRMLRSNRDLMDNFEKGILEADPMTVTEVAINDRYTVKFIKPHLAEIQEILKLENIF